MKKIFNSKLPNPQKAFTLIELLVVIAVLGVLAAGVLIAIDPVDKVNSANDSKAQTDVATVANAAEAYAVSNNNYYPGNSIEAAAASTYIGAVAGELVAAGELKIAPVAPAGYIYYFYASTGAAPTDATTCIGGRAGSTATCKAVVVMATLKSKKYTGRGIQRYESYTGKTCQVAAAATPCP